MSNKPSLAEALKPLDRVVAGAEPPPKRHWKSSPPPSRAGKKALIGYFNPEVSKQLKQITLVIGIALAADRRRDAGVHEAIRIPHRTTTATAFRSY